MPRPFVWSAALARRKLRDGMRIVRVRSVTKIGIAVDTVRFVQVDVFTDQPFRGNPVAVVLDAGHLDTAEMQRIANWTNLSETTFVLPPESPSADYRLRIFTPRQELPFAGHPSIGSAHAAIECGIARPANGRLRQECLAGVLELTIEQTPGGRIIYVHGPETRITAVSAAHGVALLQALERPLAGNSRPLRIDTGPVWLVAELDSTDVLAGLEPDMSLLSDISRSLGATGATLFAASTEEDTALHVRSFAPLHGVPEDPVCGSGNICVAAYLRYTGGLARFGARYIARQGMQMGRDGRVSVRIDQDGIRIGGHAVSCVEGMLRVR